MVLPSAPRTNRTLSEIVPERCFDPSPGTSACAPPGRASSSSVRAMGHPEQCRDENSGTKAPIKNFRSVRDRRSPVTTRRMSRIAKGRYERPAVLKTSACADSQKRRSPVPFRIASRARKRESYGRGRHWSPTRFPTRTRLVMPNHIDIDHRHSRAMVQEIGERLRASLKPEPELPGNFRTQINRLRELEEQSPSIIPAAERWSWGKPRR
jgi:hypothetical protein